MRAAIYVQHGKADLDKQESTALRYATASGLAVIALCSDRDNCLALVAGGVVDVIVSALPIDSALTVAAREAGGEVVVVRERPAPRHRERREVGTLAVRMWRDGMPVRKIAQYLEVDTREIRRILGRLTVLAPCVVSAVNTWL